MAPIPLSFKIYTDRWGNHRTGDSSTPASVGGFLTDLWGSHRGVSTPVVDGATKRSIPHEQGFFSQLIATVMKMPTWWYFLFAFTTLWFCLVSWAAYTRKFKNVEKLVVRDGIGIEGEDEINRYRQTRMMKRPGMHG